MTLLKGRERELLREVLRQHKAGEEDIIERLEAGAITRDQRSELCRLISREFTQTGLGDDDEPNARGIEIEALLDTVNRPNFNG